MLLVEELVLQVDGGLEETDPPEKLESHPIEAGSQIPRHLNLRPIRFLSNSFLNGKTVQFLVHESRKYVKK